MRLPPPSLGLKLGVSLTLFVGLSFALLKGHLPSSPVLKWLILSLYGIGGCLLATWWMVDRPIRELIRVMEGSEKKDFLVRTPVRSRDVVGQLARSFNRLLQRITTLDAFTLESESHKKALQEKTEIIERTNRDLESRVTELSLINEFSQKIVSTLELSELHSILDDFLGNRVGFSEYALLLCEEGEGEEEAVVQVGRGFADSSRIRGMRFKAGEGLTGAVLHEKKPCYIRDTRVEPRYLYYKGERKEDGSFLSIPLLFKERVVGILNFTRSGVDSFSPQEIQFLNTIAVEIAIALVNAQLYSRTRELSVRDELTRLYNRRHFSKTLPMELKRADRFGQPLSLLMIDIDQFKWFNDTFGHPEGDKRLCEVAGLMSGKIREVDFFARYGGEEFVVILPNTSKKDGLAVAEKLRHLVRTCPFELDCPDPEHPFTISIGLASYPVDAASPDELLTAADKALYQAKGAGRDRVVAFALVEPTETKVAGTG